MDFKTCGKYDFNGKTVSQMPSVANIAKETRNYLGVGMAEKEWVENPKLASKKFLHTEAYHRFLDEETLVLLGRTGTGKTSILRCVKYNIENNKCDLYTHVLLEDFTDIYTMLLEQSSTDSENIKMKYMKTIIDTTIMTMIMVYIINEFPNSTELRNVKEYLIKNNLHSKHTYIQAIKKAIGAYRSSSTKNLGKIYNSIADIYSFIKNEMSPDFITAKTELIEFLSDKKVLVMFDSLDSYNMSEKNEVLAVKALISICFEYYKYNNQSHIYLKIALPSEVHTRVLDSLPGKQQGNAVLIQWKYKDLVKFVALRFFYWAKELKTKAYRLDLNFINNYKCEDFFFDNDAAYNNSKNLLTYFLPNTCPTCFLFEFDTISYCLRHTLKKPREVLTIFNALIEELVNQKNIHYFIDEPRKIKDIIHSTQERMVKSALSMYESTFPRINEACYIVLNSTRFVFSLSDIRDRLKEAEQLTREYYDKEEIIRVLFESGLVGVLNEVRHIDKHYEIFKTDEPFDFIIANFEYQIKGKITPTLGDQYVIHPMCYEYYRCFVDNCSMVYPNRFADEEDIISLILNNVV